MTRIVNPGGRLVQMLGACREGPAVGYVRTLGGTIKHPGVHPAPAVWQQAVAQPRSARRKTPS